MVLMYLFVVEFCSPFVGVFEFDKSIGFDIDWLSLLFDNGGLDDVVLIPLVVGLTLLLE